MKTQITNFWKKATRKKTKAELIDSKAQDIFDELFISNLSEMEIVDIICKLKSKTMAELVKSRSEDLERIKEKDSAIKMLNMV